MMTGFIKVTQISKDAFENETDIPSAINANLLRTFYHRRDANASPGTRLTFDDGRGLVIREGQEQLLQMLEGLGLHFMPVSMIIRDNDIDADDVPDEEEASIAAYIAPDHLKAFYPRKFGRSGTRLTFKNGNGFAIKESFDEFERDASPPALN